MLANLKKSIILSISVISLTSCSFVAAPLTPKEWGNGAGEYAAEEWIKTNGVNRYPTADSIALYCVNISEDGQKKYDWTFVEAYEATMACTEAFAKGLGLD